MRSVPEAAVVSVKIKSVTDPMTMYAAATTTPVSSGDSKNAKVD